MPILIGQSKSAYPLGASKTMIRLNPVRKKIANRVVRAMSVSCMHQAEVSRRSGVNRETLRLVKKIASGDVRQSIELDTLIRICLAIRRDPDEVLSGAKIRKSTTGEKT